MRQQAVAGGRYVPELECLRGVAITLVFLYHVDGIIDGSRGHRFGVWPTPWRALIQGGHTGVSLFFILSAFLLALPFLQEAAGGKTVDRARYYERRALRILPLYWLVVLASDVVLAHKIRDLLNGVPYLVFLNALPSFSAALFPLNGVWWSLATEVQFYLLLPLLPYLLRRPRIGIVVAALFAGVYVWVAANLPVPFETSGALSLRASLIGRAPMFAAGISSAWLYLNYGKRFRAWAVHRLSNGAGDACLIALVLLLGTLLRFVVHSGYWQMELTAHSWHVAEAVLWAAIVWVVLLVPLRMRSLVVNPFAEAVGRWSYSIYLSHLPLVYLALRILPFQSPENFTGWHARDFGIVAVLALSTLALSSFSYRFIEKPFLRRKAQLQR